MISVSCDSSFCYVKVPQHSPDFRELETIDSMAAVLQGFVEDASRLPGLSERRLWVLALRQLAIFFEEGYRRGPPPRPSEHLDSALRDH